MGLLSLLAVLKARKLTILYAMAVAGVAALSIALLLPKAYVATARVQVDSLKENLLTGLFEPRVRVPEFLGQQAALASSRTVALKVYDTLVAERFFDPRIFEDEWREKTGGELIAGNDPRLWAADELLDDLTVNANELESTITYAYRGVSAAESARVANAFANAYMEIVLEQRQRRAARNAANFSEETRALEEGVEDAQRSLTNYREATGIVGLGAQRLEDIEVELAALTMRLAEARTDNSEAQSLLTKAQEATENELLTLPLPEEAQAGRQAQARLGAVQVQVQRLSERYGSAYPPFIEAVNEKRALERTIMQAIIDRADFAARRVGALEADAKAKKAAVLALQERKQTYDLLSKNVETRRDAYDLVASRTLQENLQSRIDVVEVTMLARAVPPEHPAILPAPVILLLGLFGGFMIGASAAVALELVEGRVRDAAGASHALRASIVAEVSRSRRPRRRIRIFKRRVA